MSVIAADLCAVIWGAGFPPPPPSPGSGSPPGSSPPYNVSGGGVGIRFNGSFNNNYWFIGELINDSQSKLVGAVINEVDVSLKRVGNPTGYLFMTIFQGNGNAIGGSSASIDVSTLTTGFVNYKFPLAYGGVQTPYQFQVGDRIVFSGPPTTSTDYILIDINKNDAYDGNHTVLVGFTATGIYPSGGKYGVWSGLGGTWAVLTGQDLAGTFYS